MEAAVNGRVHRETGRVPAEALAEERAHLHRLPVEPYTVALGETRKVNPDQTIRFGSVRYSTPPGHVDTTAWCRVAGDEREAGGGGPDPGRAAVRTSPTLVL